MSNKTRVLLVEDNPADAERVELWLEPVGWTRFQITHVTSLTRAREALQGAAFELILTDLRLPDADDLEAIPALKALAGSAPIVAITGSLDSSAGVGALQLGAQDFLSKDATGEQVRRALQFALLRSRHHTASLAEQEDERTRLVRELAAGISHRINNPATYIMLNLQEILSGLTRIQHSSDPSPLIRDLSQLTLDAQSGIERIAEVVRMLQPFARPPGSRPVAVSPAEALETAWRHIDPSLAGRVRLLRNLGSLPDVAVDSESLVSVFSALLRNALESMPPDSRSNTIQIDGVRRGDRVRITIQDNGSGIDPAIRARIFEPFFSTRDALGLGLALSAAIVGRCGGMLQCVESSSGACFMLELPVGKVR